MTGPLGRGLAFAVDFAAALGPRLLDRRDAVAGRRGRRDRSSRVTRRCRRPSQSCPTRGRGSRSRSRPRTSTAAIQRAARGARARDAAARLPQGQSAAVAGDPAARLRRRSSRRRSASRCPSGTKRRCSTPASARSATPTSRSSRRPRTRASRSSFKFEIGVRPGGRARRLQGPRGRARPRPRRPRRSSTARSSGSARASPSSSRSSAPPPTATSLLIDFEGLLDGKAFEGGKADDYLLELGSGQLIEGFEEQLVGAEAGRGARGRGHLPRRLPGRAAGRRRRGLQGRGQRGAGEDPARARRRLRLRGLGVRHARGAARRHPRETRPRSSTARTEQDFRVAAVDAAADEATVDASRRARHRPRRGTLGAGGTPARRARHGPRRLPADAGQNARGADRGVEARRRARS